MAWMRTVIVAPLRAALRRLASSLTVSAPVAVRVARPSDLVPSLASAATLAPAAVRTVKRSFLVLRRAFSETVLAIVTPVSARGFGVAVATGVRRRPRAAAGRRP